jgi:hypothetical protein
MWAVTWLLCYVASYSALLPRDCCAAHAHRSRPTAAKAAEAAADATCSLHHAPEPEPPPPAECSLRGTCGGPIAALASFLSSHGILPGTVDVNRDANITTFALHIRENATSLAVAPDPHPPRA